MVAPDVTEVIAVMRDYLRRRLGLELDEFHTADELIERWIRPGMAEGKTAAEIADAFAEHMHYKYDLTWMPESWRPYRG